MGSLLLRAILLLSAIAIGNPVHSQDSRIAREIAALPWKKAPEIGYIGAVSNIKLTGDLAFLDASSSSKFIELNGNPPRQNNYVLAPWPVSWFAVFIFDPSGYVRDNDRLDADELLHILKQQNEKSVEERRRLHLPILQLTGWAVEPHYDLRSKRLEWGTRFVVEGTGEEAVNYTIRILGRSGVMSVVLVSDPTNLKEDIRSLRTALNTFDFVNGERYSEYRQGDRTAEYGLAALVVGGAAAAAAKSGVLKGLGKFIGIAAIAALAAIATFFRSLFRKRKGS